MLRKIGYAAIAALIGLTGITWSASAAVPEDACALLTADQVSRAIGASVGNGSYVTPTFKKTCTWTAPGKIITLSFQTLEAYDAGRRTRLATALSGIGEDAYFLGVGSTVGLLVKKGNIAFKIAVYARMPPEENRAMEKALADQVLSKL
jgi:hypothetical protein